MSYADSIYQAIQISEARTRRGVPTQPDCLVEGCGAPAVDVNRGALRCDTHNREVDDMLDAAIPSE